VILERGWPSPRFRSPRPPPPARAELRARRPLGQAPPPETDNSPNPIPGLSGPPPHDKGRKFSAIL
jgi:hypothetical protein